MAATQHPSHEGTALVAVIAAVLVSLTIGFLLGRRWFPRRTWILGSSLLLPRYIVRLEPVNVVLYAGEDLAAAKAAYALPVPAEADQVQFYEAGKFRGRRTHNTEKPTRE